MMARLFDPSRLGFIPPIDGKRAFVRGFTFRMPKRRLNLWDVTEQLGVPGVAAAADSRIHDGRTYDSV
jgi:hypothetical protein